MEKENYIELTKKIINCIFNNQDINVIIPYLSKSIKAMGLYTENVLTYQDILEHIQQYKDNDFSFNIENIISTIVYENDVVSIVEGSFYLNMQSYHTKSKYFYTLIFKLFSLYTYLILNFETFCCQNLSRYCLTNCIYRSKVAVLQYE